MRSAREILTLAKESANRRRYEMVWKVCALGALIALSAVATAADPRSERYVWRNVVVGGGGFAPNLLFSPAEPGLAYLRTDMGGAYRWDASAARWLPLQDDQAEGSYMGVESIAPDPRDPAVVYMATGMSRSQPAAIQRSADRGTSWTITPVPFRMGGNEDGRGLGERLAIDPHRTSTLFFGSRHDGLWRSTDRGTGWAMVAGFPVPGRGVPPRGRPTNAGIAFIQFDPASGAPGGGSRTLFAGVADPGARHLFRSDDGGERWKPVPGGPPSNLLPVKAAIDAQRRLFIAYASAMGPNGIARGAVWRLDTVTGRWTDITPDPASDGGYMGLALDRGAPGRVVVSTVNRYRAGDTVWLSDDAGAHWGNLKERSHRDTTAAPFLNWGKPEADFGHWIAGLAIDPFDGRRIAYTTGDTVYATMDARTSGTLLWKPWVTGIEQTAVITLVSPTGGAPLASGFGDLGGFVHDRLDVSPPGMHLNPRLHNTNNLDYAGMRPAMMVRSGTLPDPDPATVATLGWSADGGRSWHPLRVPALAVGGRPLQRYDTRGEAAISVSADGATFLVATPIMQRTTDRGRRWSAVIGLPEGARAIADKVDPQRFYAIDFATSRMFVSRDGGAQFVPAASAGLPAGPWQLPARGREAQWPLVAETGRAGRLWLQLGGALWRSDDGGERFFRASADDVAIELFGLGRSAIGGIPALYAIATSAGLRGVWRSNDGGAGWHRINDDRHQWGLRFRAIAGDPRRIGRVYIATDGRGIFYGDPR